MISRDFSPSCFLWPEQSSGEIHAPQTSCFGQGGRRAALLQQEGLVVSGQSPRAVTKKVLCKGPRAASAGHHHCSLQKSAIRQPHLDRSQGWSKWLVDHVQLVHLWCGFDPRACSGLASAAFQLREGHEWWQGWIAQVQPGVLVCVPNCFLRPRAQDPIEVAGHSSYHQWLWTSRGVWGSQ